MRYLLLSVLAVCVIGILVPSAFGQIGPNYEPPPPPTYPVDYKSIAYDVLYLGVVPAAIIILVVIVIKKMRRKKYFSLSTMKIKLRRVVSPPPLLRIGLRFRAT